MLKRPRAADTAVPVVGLDELCRLAAQQIWPLRCWPNVRPIFDDRAPLVDATGYRMVVGNGYLPEREVVTGAGPVTVKSPRVGPPRGRSILLGAGVHAR